MKSKGTKSEIIKNIMEHTKDTSTEKSFNKRENGEGELFRMSGRFFLFSIFLSICVGALAAGIAIRFVLEIALTWNN